MSKLTPDNLWKGIIESLFEDFMYFFYDEDADQIDFKKDYEFLDNELQTIYPDSESPNRRVDKLVKVFLKDGTEKWILIHIEVQGYYDKDMAYRAYTYNYRISDKYQKPVSTIVIYTDDNPNFHPKKYVQRGLKTEVIFSFHTYKLLDHPPKRNMKSDNIFAYAMEMAWYGVKRNKLNDTALLKHKTAIVKRLAKKGFSMEKIYFLLVFIRFYIPFEKSNFMSKFEKNIQPLTKINKVMSIQELVQNAKKEEGKIEGKIEGIEITISVINLINEGKSVDFICKKLNISEDVVNNIKTGIKNK